MIRTNIPGRTAEAPRADRQLESSAPGGRAGFPLPGEPDGRVQAVEPNLILLIEDDFVLRSSLTAMLQGEGYRVECAANGLDALRRLDRAPKPALILLDIMLPYMNGIEFRARQLKTSGLTDIPVIVITAMGVRPEDALELDLHQAFFKPLDKPRLMAAIRRHCAPNAS